jgi:hypothetical protein
MDEEIKYYKREDITKLYQALTYKERCSILYDALDWMEQYNGRSKFKCIALAMGFDNTEGDTDSFFKRNP